MPAVPASPAASLTDDFAALVAGDPEVDRYALFARMRAESPVFFSTLLNAWVVTRFDDILVALRDADAFGPPLEGPGSAVYGAGFLHWRGREHNKKTGIIARRVRSPRAFTEHLDAQVADTVRQVLDRLPTGTPVDIREEFAVAIPVIVIADLTGIEEATKVRQWYDDLMAGGTAGIANPDPNARELALKTIRELKEVLAPIIEDRKRNPGTDIVSDLVQARYDGEPLPFDEVVAIVAHLLPAGAETTARALSAGLAQLAADPAEYAALRAVRDDTEALRSYSAELLRYHPPLQSMTRIARSDAEVGGHAVAEGERLVLIVGSANRDETHFEAPDTFDPQRFADNPDRQFTANASILPFGAGEHHCPGTRLAAAEMVHPLQQLLERHERMELVEPPSSPNGLFNHSPTSVRVVLH